MSIADYKAGRVIWRLTNSVLVIVTAMIYTACRYLQIRYGVSAEEIINTLFLPTEGTAASVIWDAVRYCLPRVVLFGIVAAFLICLADATLFKSKTNRVLYKLWKIGIPVFCLCSVILSFVYVDSVYGIRQYLNNKKLKSTIYEDYYVDLLKVSLGGNEEKRNIIYIYIESMENTYSSFEKGGAQEINYIPNLTRLAEDNISFSNKDNLGGIMPSTGTGWTMAGLLASTSGVPFSFPIQGNDMDTQELFGSGLHTMGDLLKREGYDNYFLCGSDAGFAGRDKYFLQHGDYKIFDYHSAVSEGYIPEGYYVWWGYEDSKLYEIAKDKLTNIASAGTPFNFTMLTVDMHAPSGYVCEKCENKYSEQLANVVECADRQVGEFIEWIQKQDFYENTTIVIMGDHIRMDRDLVSDIGDYERTVYNCFINTKQDTSDTNEKNRVFTTEDIFPTVIGSMGYNIKGNRLGLGTNLFSGQQTLAEKLGIDMFNTMLTAGPDYYIEHFSPEFKPTTLRDQISEEKCLTTVHFWGDEYNLDHFEYSGISERESGYSWTDGYVTGIKIPISSKCEKLLVSIKVVGTYMINQPRYVIKCNGEEILSGTADYYGFIEFETDHFENYLDITIELPDAISPTAYDPENPDTRVLSLALDDMKIYELSGDM